MKKIFTLSIFTFISLSIVAQAPVFFGMTSTGGSTAEGTIISFNPTGNVETVVHNFGTGSDGYNPWGSFIYNAANRLFYGMTKGGGSLGLGTIISLNPATLIEDTVHSFGRGDDGQQPYGDLVYDATNGLFYGMTYDGGSLGEGAIVTFNPVTNAEDTVHSFGSGDDGQHPLGDLVYDATHGLFYGMTSNGGNIGSGAIISFNPTTYAEDTLHSFGNGSDGSIPYASLVYCSGTGLYYGMTAIGGNGGWGAIISYNPTTHVEDTVHSFGSGTDAKTPYGSNLVYDAANGLFYGMTKYGGTSDDGAIFSFNPSTLAESVVHSFGAGADGEYPEADLVYYAANGLFYGMTYGGGSNGLGAIISFNPTGNVETVVHSFGTGSDGQHPQGNLVLYTPPTGIDEVNSESVSIKVYPNPSSGVFTLRAESEKVNVESAMVEIYNMLGETVYSQSSTFNSPLSINLSSQPEGIYLYRVITETGALVGQGKLILQK